MKRFHVHVAVNEMADSVRFYSAVFGIEPTVLKDDYAKWMLEDPRINFAISKRGQKPGVDHLGLQVEDEEELHDMRGRLETADGTLAEQTAQPCCYAKSDKYWITDPQGIAWETFHTLDSIPVFGEDTKLPSAPASACCVPVAQITRKSADQSAACCVPRGTTVSADSSCC
jgi:catechol 2,3-dioxygenase-like lactoylglutathione lyase family enzyme